MPKVLRSFQSEVHGEVSLRRLRYFEQAAGQIQEGSTLLDVGCGVNRLLQCIAQERGVIGTGLDFKPEIVRYVRDRLQMPIVEGSLASASFADASFDAVMMMEYLEHELDPRSVLDEARRITKPGGHLALELPHIAAWPGRRFGLLLALPTLPIQALMPVFMFAVARAK